MLVAARGLLLAALASAAVQAQPPAPMAIQPLKPGLWMVTGDGGNVTVLAAEHGLILVDDKLAGEATFDALAATIRRVSALPVQAVFDTHYHPDHVGNNARFLDAHVPVIGTDELAARLAAAGGTGVPNIQFSRDFSLVLTRGRVDAHHYWPGHTDGDAVIHFPRARVVATGDLVVAGTPVFDYPGGADVGGWLRTLDAILALDWDVAVPGHGDRPMTRADVQAFRARLAAFAERGRAAVRAGTPEARLVAAIRVDDLGWTWGPNAWPRARLDGLWHDMGGR